MADAAPLVRVRLPSHLTAGWPGVPTRLEVRAASFTTLLVALDQAAPGVSRRLADDRGSLRPHLLLFVNEDAVRHEDAGRLRLHAGDRILFIASVSGG